MRVSGLPIGVVEALRGTRVISAYHELIALDARLSTERDRLGLLLYAEIGNVTDKPIRNRLLQVRRDLLNGRGARAIGDAEASALSAATLSDIVRCQQLISERAMLIEQFSAHYDSDIAESRRRFQMSLGDDDFRRGLALSSPTLSLNLRKYERTEVERFGSREEQIERGLLRYFTRTAMKATPFGTLCGILAGHFVLPAADAVDAVPALFDGNPRDKRAVVRLNKSLFRVLWNHLKTRPSVRSSLTVELTPTLVADGDVWRFLTAVGDREVFQRLRTNDAISRIIPILREHSGRRVSELVTVLREDPEIDASDDDAVAFLDQLIAIGLLRFRSGISEQDADWDLPFSQVLHAIDDPHANAIATLLSELRQRLVDYGGAQSLQREVIAGDIRTQLGACCDMLGVGRGLRSDLPFYEDAAAQATLNIALTPDIEESVERLGEFIELLLPISYVRNEQATMRHFFDARYGGAISTIPLLQFYEDFYRDHFKTHLERERQAGTPEGRAALGDYEVRNPFKLEVIRRHASAVAAIAELMRRRWAEDETVEQIDISRAELEAAMSAVEPLSPRQRSVSVFCQLDAPSAAIRPRPSRFVLPGPHIHVGRGKYFSRFLYLLPTAVLDQVYADNNAASQEWRAEICADAQFNANLHPRLLRWEISYPTAETGGLENQLLSSDLDVSRDPEDPFALRLLHRPTGAVVVPFDLGFLNPRMRPPLFQLLSRFTQVGAISLSLPDSLARVSALRKDPGGQKVDEVQSPPPAVSSTETQIANSPADRVEHRPRITFAGRVVIGRRRWTIPFSLFPKRDPRDRDSDYFLRVNQWRDALGIPEQVYVRVRPAPISSGLPHGSIITNPPDGEDVAEILAGESPEDSQVSETAVREDYSLEMSGESVHRTEDRELESERHVRSTVESEATTVRGSAGSAATVRVPRDWGKPQFVDFSAPLLVKLFGQLPSALPRFTLWIEERLPDADGLPDAGVERHVTELVLQFDFEPTPQRETVASTAGRR